MPCVVYHVLLSMHSKPCNVYHVSSAMHFEQCCASNFGGPICHEAFVYNVSFFGVHPLWMTMTSSSMLKVGFTVAEEANA